jgi:UDP-glucose:(heptosyl)LPS alpha-1,3-glucosyltransferase
MAGLDVYYTADSCYAEKLKDKSFVTRALPRAKQFLADEQAVFSQDSHTQILMISKVQQALYQAHYQTQNERVHFLPPGIDKAKMRPANYRDIRQGFRQEMGVSEDALCLLMVGSGFRTKGLDRALRAMAVLPAEMRAQCQLWVVGQDRPQAFKCLAKQLGIAQQVHFLGGRSDVDKFYLGADILIHPAYFENTGTVLLEAMASGLPVLVTENCGYASYIQESGSGCLIPSPFQQRTLNQKLLDMLQSIAEGSRHWAEAGVNFACHADIYSMTEHAVSVIESCLSQQQSKAMGE